MSTYEKRVEYETKIKEILEKIEISKKRSQTLFSQLEVERKRFEVNFKRKPIEYNYKRRESSPPVPLKEVTNRISVTTPSNIEKVSVNKITETVTPQPTTQTTPVPTQKVETVKKEVKVEENVIAQRLDSTEKQQLEHVSRPKQNKKKPPSRNANLVNSLKETENQTNVAPPSKDSFAELEKKSAQENVEIKTEETKSEVKKVIGGVNPFGGYKPGGLQKTESMSEPKKMTGGSTNPFGGFQPGGVQLKKVESEKKMETKESEEKTEPKKVLVGAKNPFGGFQPGNVNLRKTEPK